LSTDNSLQGSDAMYSVRQVCVLLINCTQAFALQLGHISEYS